MLNEATVNSAAVSGIDGRVVRVSSVFYGGRGLEIRGLSDVNTRETRVRVRSALEGIGHNGDGVTVSVESLLGTFDLAVATATLVSQGVIPSGGLEGWVLIGELSLLGALRPVRGVLSMVRAAKAAGMRGVVVPADNAVEACLIEGIEIRAALELESVVGFFTGKDGLVDARALSATASRDQSVVDLTHVRGQAAAKRALEVAAAGGHNLLFVGPHNVGRTILAGALPGLLPALTAEEALEVACVHSVAGMPLRSARPFRAPHHTVSTMGMVGGGDPPRPGELSLAHRGVLFLDELPEFSPEALRAVEGAMQFGTVTVRGHKFPTKFQLVAAMLPCPCGYFGTPNCRCSTSRAMNYRARVARPMLDRFDMVVSLDHPGEGAKTSSSEVHGRVAEARARLAGGKMTEGTWEAWGLLEKGLSRRAADSALSVARTIAALAGSDCIAEEHAAEAVGYPKGL